jgi:hypothetical protein
VERPDAVGIGGLECVVQRVADRPHARVGALTRVGPPRSSPTETLSKPPALQTKSGGPQNPALGQRVGEPVARELVVGPARDRAAAQLGTVSSSSTPPNAHEREQVDLPAVSASLGTAQRAPSSSASARLQPGDVQDHQLGTVPSEPSSRIPPPDMPEPHHRHAAAAQVASQSPNTRSATTRSAISQPSAVHGLRWPLRQVDDVPGLLGDHLYVLDRSADVLGVT